jgi:hypothetical protein
MACPSRWIPFYSCMGGKPSHFRGVEAYWIEHSITNSLESPLAAVRAPRDSTVHNG